MRLFLKLALVLSLLLPARARAQEYATYGYMGPHPVPYDVGSGYCYQQGAHFHEYPPFDQYLFREYGGWFYFVGDPADFGYAYQMWGFSGHHPIPLANGGGYCFIDWPHRHPYPPPYGAIYNNVNGYFVYGGPWDPWYWHYRPYYTRYYGGYYRQSYYGGRYWSVRPEHIYAPRVYVGAPGVYRSGAVVVAPGGARVYAQPAHPIGRVGAPPPANPVYRGGPAPANPINRGPGPAPANPINRGPGPAPANPVYRPAPAPANPVYRPAPAPANPVYRPAPAPAPAYRAPAPSYHPAPAAPARPIHR